MRMEVLKWIGGVIVAALVSYFTALGAVQQKVEHVDTREDAHFRQLMQRMDEMRQDFNGVRGEIMAIIKEDRRSSAASR